MLILKSVMDLDKYQPQITSDTLVLLDVDDTLITPTAKIFHMGCNYQPALLPQNLLAELTANLPENPIDELKLLCDQNSSYHQIIANWRLSRQVQLVEPEWLAVIAQLKAITTVYAFTKMDTGQYSIISNMEQWRYAELTRLGLTFSTQLNGQSAMRLLEIEASNGVSNFGYAAFIHGIAMTGKFNKAELLAAVLAKSQRQFKNILLVDDRPEMVQLVGDYCLSIGMPFIGLHYTGVDAWAKDINLDVVKLQQDRLFNVNIWLEDEQALAEL